MKKWMFAALTAALAAGVLAGCGAENPSTSSTPSVGSEVSSEQESGLPSEGTSGLESELPSEATSEPESPSAASSAASSSASKPSSSAASSSASKPSASEQSPQDIVKAIAKAYGEDYLPDSPMDEELIYGYFSVDKNLVESVYGETPMISVNPDQVFVMKAVSGKGAELEKELNKARDQYVETAMVYPKDMAKLSASRVVRKGDYVAFLMVGAPDETSETDEAAIKFAQKEIQKGVDAFNKAVKG